MVCGEAFPADQAELELLYRRSGTPEPRETMETAGVASGVPGRQFHVRQALGWHALLHG
jgi:hypothetical protein